MNLYIETENGGAKNHPAFEENLIQGFGSVPDGWEPFIRVERPTLGVYEVLQSSEPTYAKVNGVWTDVWDVREMTPEEKTAKQQAVIRSFNERRQAENWSAWTFNEALCKMVPPFPRSDDWGPDVLVIWCGAENNWRQAPAYPIDGNQYKFDFIAWEWFQVVDA